MISSLRLQHFRSYKDASFEFDAGVNIVVGPNACGKTNLLEAVLVLAKGSSYRAKPAELIKFGKPWGRLDAFFERQSRVLKLEESPEGARRTILIDDQPFTRLSLDRTVPIVLFEPNNLQLLIRGPETRREYLDDLLTQTVEGYKTMLAGYKRAVSQRNSLLKKEHLTKDQLFVWNVRISELGGGIVSARQALIEQMNKVLSKSYSAVAQKKSNLQAVYRPTVAVENYSSSLLKKLEASTQLDQARGFTAYGPHREDVLFELNKESAEHSASRGETRTILLALKIFELEQLEAARGQKPILLLDDVFSELDASRRRYLVEFLKNHQTIISTTDADAVVQHFTGNYNTIALN